MSEIDDGGPAFPVSPKKVEAGVVYMARDGLSNLEVKREPLRMNAYYYSFSSTGCYEVDRILSAVACAGKAFHNTDCWTDECDPYDGHVGGNPIDWIQNAANDCATAFKTIYEAGRKAERERCAKIVETENVKFYANGFISQKWIICGEIAEKIRGGQDGK